MIQRIREHVLYGTLTVVLLAFVAAAFYGLYRLSESQQSLGKRLPGETLWATTQTEIELLRLSAALSSFVQGETDAETVALRFDIFWSQAGLLESGDIHSSIAAMPEHAGTLQALRDTLDRADKLLPQIEEGAIDPVTAAQEMRAQLEALTSPLHTLTIAVVQSDVIARSARIKSTLDILRDVAWFFVAALVIAGVIGLGLVVGRRKLQREVRVRKQAERALQERDAHLRDAAQMAHLGYWSWDHVTDTYLNVSQEYAAILGYPSTAAFLARQTKRNDRLGAVHVEDRERIRQILASASPASGRVSTSYRILTTASRVRQVREIAEYFFDNGGRLIRSTGTLQDVTESHRAEEALRESEERYRHMIEHGQGLICIHDMDGTITLVNSAAAQALGFEQEAMIGHCLAEFIAPSARNDFGEYLQRVAVQGSDSGLLRVQTCDGEERVWAYKNTVYSPTNEPPHVLGNAQDITKLVQTEQELHFALQEAERASNAKSDFLARMSHELRTPMNSILGFGQLIDSDPETPLDRRHAAMMDRILDAGRHLLGLINDILDLAKIEHGGVEVRMGVVNVSELTGECIELSQNAAVPSNVKIVNHLKETGCPLVWADEIRLKQVLLNLLSNAVKYNVSQGNVSITWRVAADNRIAINVSDTGPGIEQAELGKLFRPFHRLGAERSGIEGTGIGLVIAKRLAESMKGNLTVESTSEIGSTFTVELMQAPRMTISVPVVDDHCADTEIARGRELTALQCLILHIEDEPSNLWLIQEIMGRYPGIQLLDAPDAQSGLHIARAREPDIILLDINLPDMNGFEVFERLAADPRTHAIPIIAVSADAMPEQVERAMDLGFFGYITKPFVIDELVAVIDQARFARTEGAGRLSRIDVNHTIH